ncbi:MAG: hypothetical protein KC736_03135 [Candidatus Moranbacteria bacterium]|nr:hypothetical protein [Candidatus Moranbacteria bacterium]
MINDIQEISPEEKSRKIESLREMIASAEKTIQGAKSMLLQIEGKKKTGRKRKFDDEENGTIVHGTFDGQIMIGTDGKQYPVPANYASKSKLVEGDMLKLTIADNGAFMYKQVGPIERKNAIGIVSQDEVGNYYVLTDGRPYKILLASVTYFKMSPGDEVAIILPLENEASWAAIENVLQPNAQTPQTITTKDPKEEPQEEKEQEHVPQEENLNTPSQEENPQEKIKNDSEAIIDEWTPDIEEIEREIQEEMNSRQ